MRSSIFSAILCEIFMEIGCDLLDARKKKGKVITNIVLHTVSDFDVLSGGFSSSLGFGTMKKLW